MPAVSPRVVRSPRAPATVVAARGKDCSLIWAGLVALRVAARYAPATIPPVLSARRACYCGSGKRYKRCHGAVRGSTAENLDDIREAVRPVFAASNDVPGCPINFGGSCCIVAYRGDPWIVTARHVLRARGAEPHEIRVPVEALPGVLTFFETRSCLWPVDQREPDAEWLDLTFIRIERGQKPFAYVDLDDEPIAELERATFDDAIRVYGYPLALDSGIDYEGRRVQLEAFGVDGAYWGATSSRFVHRATFTNFGKVTDLNGMSGGPAFYARPGSGEYRFAGIVITGSVLSRRMHFIDASAVVKTLRWHYDDDPSAPGR